MGSSPSAAAFDAAAPTYDARFSTATNPVVRMLRQRVHRAVARHFPPGASLLDLGCGTGEDALELTKLGYRITAADPAPGMIAAAKAKLAAPGRANDVVFLGKGLRELADTWPPSGDLIDGVISNFAPLNCELSLAPLRSLLEQALRPGGRFVGVVLPKIAPLEILVGAARGRLGAAVRRFRKNPVGDVDGRRFPMRYYGVRDFDRALGGGFRRVEARSLGLFLPPPDLGPRLGRVPGLLPALAALEDHLGALPGLRGMGDHILLAYERAS